MLSFCSKLSRLGKSSFCIAFALLMLSGCAKEKVELGIVHGKVTYKSKPLTFGSVMLLPSSGGGKAATGKVQSDGTFKLSTKGMEGTEGVLVGIHRIRVTCFPAQDPNSNQSSQGEMALGKSLIPTEYNSFGASGLTIEVVAGENEPLILELE